MAIDYQHLRALALEYLKDNPDGRLRFRQAEGELWGLCIKRGLEPDEVADGPTVQQIFHELYLERILVTGTPPTPLAANAENMTWPHYRLTEYGQKVLNAVGYLPYDPEGYLDRLKRDVAGVDPIIVRYLGEALSCLRCDCLLASAVMLGCAAEKAILLLVDAVGNALSNPKQKAKFAADTNNRRIKRQFDELWKRLEPLAGSLPTPLGDDLEVILPGVFGLIRATRNDAGHPTGKSIYPETAHANLILYPGYCRRVYELIAHFAANPIK